MRTISKLASPHLYESLIIKIADRTHEKFKEIYQKHNNGTRVKPTTDAAWTKKHGTNLADLAKLDYQDLPSDWKNERWCGSKEALNALIDSLKLRKPLDASFVEYAADRIHQEWLNRNMYRAEKDHQLTYKDLTEEDKDKDRVFALAAIEIYNSLTQNKL